MVEEGGIGVAIWAVAEEGGAGVELFGLLLARWLVLVKWCSLSFHQLS